MLDRLLRTKLIQRSPELAFRLGEVEAGRLAASRIGAENRRYLAEITLDTHKANRGQIESDHKRRLVKIGAGAYVQVSELLEEPDPFLEWTVDRLKKQAEILHRDIRESERGRGDFALRLAGELRKRRSKDSE